jgi:pyroglutamyl-peptidase
MKALVTGFEPFGGDTVNPAEEAVQLVKPRLGDLEVVTCVLPASFAQSTAALVRTIEAVRPDIVLCVGQAGGRAALSLERVAINVQDARITDNDRAQPIDVPVVPRGPAAYFATLPIKAAVAALRQAGLPAEVSNSAGTFVCNHIFYSLMHAAAQAGQRFRAGFLHIPLLPEQAASQRGAASMALADVVRGIEIILRAAVEHEVDVRAAEGAIS